jgi:hypothetical protein
MVSFFLHAIRPNFILQPSNQSGGHFYTRDHFEMTFPFMDIFLRTISGGQNYEDISFGTFFKGHSIMNFF